MLETSSSSISRKLTAQKLFLNYSSFFQSISTISSDDILQASSSTSPCYFIDVRTEDEIKISKLPNSVTKHKFENEIMNNIGKDVLLIPYCTIGYRSGVYGTYLLNNGFTNVKNGEGVVLWTYTGKPLIKDLNNFQQETYEVHTYGKKWDLLADGYISYQFTTLQFIFITIRSFITGS